MKLEIKKNKGNLNSLTVSSVQSDLLMCGLFSPDRHYFSRNGIVWKHFKYAEIRQ